MSTKTKFYTLLTGFLLLSCAAFAQNMLEQRSYTNVPPTPTAPIVGDGFGPRVTNHVITFDRDNNNNSQFTTQGSNPNPIAGPFITTTVSFANQQFTGLPYGAGTVNGAGTSNAVSTGLVFGAGPTNATGPAPGTPATQQASPLNSYDLMAAFGNNWGPRNGMFMSDPTATPTASPFPTQSGTGLNAEGILSGPANDGNGGVCVFTCTQVMFDQARVHNSTTRHYYGDVIVSFSRFVADPVIHIAGLGGSYRYLPTGLPDLTSNYLSTFFSTELELVGGFPMTKMSGNQFLALSGNFITNNNLATPNGESTDQGTPPAGQFNNFGAATGSVRINGTVRFLRFRVYIRGASSSQFNWSAPGSAVQGAAIDPITGQPRNPLTGDIWFISASVKREQLIPLPATGMRLNAVLNGSDVQLSWKTLSEIDTKEFEIQRSTDGINFTTIGTRAAAGSSAVELSYAYTDPNMQVPVYYYRLKQVDNDNDFAYSNIVPVRRASGNIKTVRVFPNPVIGQMNLEFSNAKGNYIISLYNQAGQELLSQKAAISYSVQYVPVERRSLPSGSYLLKVRNTENGELFNEKVVLQ